MQRSTVRLALLIGWAVVATAIAEPLEDATAAYRRGDYATALPLYQSLADSGNATAQVYLGYMSRDGRGVAKDDAEAVKWFRKAADQGNANGQNALGFMIREGRGVTRDDAEAVQWFRKGAEQGSADAETNLGIMYATGRGVAKDETEAVRWFRMAAAQGFAPAQNNLGIAYRDGRGGVAQDYAEAMQWFQKAADQGFQSAKSNLARLSELRGGVAKGATAAAAQGTPTEADPRTYALLSLVGNEMNIVTHETATGSGLDHNVRQRLPTNSQFFDNAAVVAAEEAIKRRNASTRVSMLAASNSSLFDDQDRFIQDQKVMLPNSIDAAVKGSGATHLILITKFRAPARMQMANETVGSGTVEGLGFYIDRAYATRILETGQTGIGFLASFVFIKLSLIDLKTSTVIQEQRVTASETYSAAAVKEAGHHPWDALSATEKTERLRRMIASEVTRVIPELVARP